jgi:hypothetical protein
MRRMTEEQDRTRAAMREAQEQGIDPLDRETLEVVMREDAFLAGDGRAPALHPSEVWARARRHGRRA